MKFSDSAYFLLEDYFNSVVNSALSELGEGLTLPELNTIATRLYYFYHNRNGIEWTTPNYWDTTSKVLNYRSYLRGAEKCIVVSGYWQDLYIKTEDVGYIGHKFAPFPNQEHINGNFFNFLKGDEISVHSEATSAFNNGDEVYFRKDSLFNAWLAPQPQYKDFVNQDKKWIYFGKIYKIDEPNKYHIEFVGMKDYALAALPEHSRTDGMTEWLKVYFDQVNQQIYNKMKNINTLIDPKEIDIVYLEYLANVYKMTISDIISERAQRDWVENLVSLLKRKGTYTSLYIPWNVLFGYSQDPLNVYERWHSPSASGDPTEEFIDVLYTLNYGVSGTGYAGGEYYNMSFGEHPNPYHSQRYKYDSWALFHNMETTDLVTQVYNANGDRFYPLTTSGDTMATTLTFDELIAGAAYTMKGSSFDYNSLSNKVDYYVANVWPGGDQDILWSDAVSGSTTDDNVDWLHYNPTSGSSWNISCSAGVDKPIIQFFDLTHTEIPSSNVTYNIGASASTSLDVSASFSPNQDGYALITQTPTQKSMEYPMPTYGPSGMILSPHYRLELDLSYEPMSGDEIMSKDDISSLLTEWEILQPVSRYANYSYVVSPITDFSGNWISTDGHTESLVTKYTSSVGSSETSGASGSIQTTVHLQNSEKDEWNIQHGLNSKDLIVQCFDINNEKMEPASITILSIDAMTITFGDTTAGEAYITTVNQGTDTLIPSASWDITHTLNKKEVLSQHYDSSYVKMVPSIQTMSTNSVSASWYSAESGRTMIVDNDYNYEQTVASSVWVLQHNFGSEGVIAQFFDSNDELIVPESITISDTSRLVAVFDSAISGWAVVNEVSGGFNESLIIEDIYNGGYWQIGNGTDNTYDPAFLPGANSIQSAIASGTDLEWAEDEDFFYISWDYLSQPEADIREFGIFNNSNFLIFYTRMNNLHKPLGTDLKVHFKIEKRGI